MSSFNISLSTLLIQLSDLKLSIAQFRELGYCLFDHSPIRSICCVEFNDDDLITTDMVASLSFNLSQREINRMSKLCRLLSTLCHSYYGKIVSISDFDGKIE
jgi:hypothetical protein